MAVIGLLQAGGALFILVVTWLRSRALLGQAPRSGGSFAALALLAVPLVWAALAWRAHRSPRAWPGVLVFALAIIYLLAIVLWGLRLVFGGFDGQI